MRRAGLEPEERAKEATLIMDPKNLDEQSTYKLLIGSVVPRPIARTSPYQTRALEAGAKEVPGIR